jgi:tetratricopeptide (TPR) repeat protein
MWNAYSSIEAGSLAMKRVWMVLGVVVVCLPMVFVGWLALAARWAKMDVVTMRMPVGMRQLVAQAAESDATWGKEGRAQQERVTRLDPKNSQAWSSRCGSFFGDTKRTADVSTCKVAVSLDGNAGNYNGLGDAQERAGDACGAEESFTRAASEDASSNDYAYTESMGRAGLRCGDLPGSRAGLETALEKAKKNLKGDDDDDDEIADTKSDMLKDREFLVIVYQKQREPALAKTACSLAHPDWKGCTCELETGGDVKCEDVKR